MKKNFKTALSLAVSVCMLISSSAVFADGEYSAENEEVKAPLRSEPVFEHVEPIEIAEDNSEDPDAEAQLFADALFGSGYGTIDLPFIIETADDLEKMVEAMASGQSKYTTASYKLAGDIDLEGKSITPIGKAITINGSLSQNYCFKGIFDGDGHTISNFVIEQNEERYVGLFGYIYNGSVKNLTVSDFSITVNDIAEYVQVGALAGRAVSLSYNDSVLENCHVKRGTIDATSLRNRVYAGGLAGYVYSSQGSNLDITGCSADVRINVVSSAVQTTVAAGDVARRAYAGGLIGYAGVSDASELNITESYALGSAKLDNSNGNQSCSVGGFIGYGGLANANSVISVDSCYAAGSVYASSSLYSYVGGFIGNLNGESGKTLAISNSYSSGSVYSYTTRGTSYPAGFIGLGLASKGMMLEATSCYTSSNVYDMSSLKSEGSKFIAAYYNNSLKFENCSSLESSDIFSVTIEPSPENVLSGDDLSLSAFGLSGGVWREPSGKYAYPTLIKAPMEYVPRTALFFDENGFYKAVASEEYGVFPALPEPPEKASTDYCDFEFSHWSVFPGEAPVDFDTYMLKSDTAFFANFESKDRYYNISFISDSKEIAAAKQLYGTEIEFPSIPAKSPESLFRYSFSHWSKEEDGEELSSSELTVTGDAVFYAVFRRITANIWDGVTEKPIDRGSGTAEDPYVISDGYQLFYISNRVNEGDEDYAGKYYLLDADIDLGGCEWTPVGDQDHSFKGTFDGDGYAVKNFKVSDASLQSAGLFGAADGAKISRLEVSEFTISGNRTYTGGIVGVGLGADISKCFAFGEISSESGYTGGIVGHLSDSESSAAFIKDSYSTVKITSSSAETGGIAGETHFDNDGSLIEHCYFAGSITANVNENNFVGGITGYSAGEAKIRSSFAICRIVSESGKVGSITGNLSYSPTENAGTSYDICAAVVGDIITEVQDTSLLFSGEYLSDELGFDFENIWVENEDALPTLSSISAPRNVFIIEKCSMEDGEMSASIKVSYRDPSPYSVFAAAYDTRGKMIRFELINVTDPTTLRSVDISFTSMTNAAECKISFVDSRTLSLKEDTITVK